MTHERTTYRGTFLAVAGLALLVALAYAPVRHHDFVQFDDPDHVSENPRVAAGLTADNVIWAFTRFANNNWHPLTWLSHLLDVELFGIDPGPHHVISVLLHLVNAILLLLVLRAMTGLLWPSALVAGLFALHPLHVESVAWISERKDVLSTLFWILTLAAYLGYALRPGVWRYLAVVATFACGLLAKPMLVTLPCVLLLCDFWPLARQRGRTGPPTGWGRLVLEKLPLFLLSIGSSAVTVLAQASGGSVVGSVEEFPLVLRLANATVSYATYLVQTVWPTGMAIYYPYPEALDLPRALAGLALLLALSALAVAQRRARPYLVVGWLWYVGTLVPVIGLVQVGTQARADRYTYVPLIGVFIAVAWAAWEALERNRRGRVAFCAASVVVLVALTAVSRAQVAHWRDTHALYGHALEVTRGNYLIHYNLGCQYLAEGRIEEAIDQFERSMRRGQRYIKAELNLGNAELMRDEPARALARFEAALAQAPGLSDAELGRGVALAGLGRHAEAREAYLRAARAAPGAWEPWHNLALVELASGSPAGAVEAWREALARNPGAMQPLIGLAKLRSRSPIDALRDGSEAVRLAEQACRASGFTKPEALDVLASAWAEQGDFERAALTAEHAAALATAAGWTGFAAEARERAAGYRVGRPARESVTVLPPGAP